MFVDCSQAEACVTADALAKWTEPVNEPCYAHDGAHCDGYVVCCVKKGTCVSDHGGMVSSTAKYYEGQCWSDESSKKAHAPGCGSNVGECDAPHIEAAKGGTSKAGNFNTIPSATLARLEANKAAPPKMCITWDVVSGAQRSTTSTPLSPPARSPTFPPTHSPTVAAAAAVKVILDANIAAFSGYGSPTGGMCTKIAEAAGVASAHVSCSAADHSGDVAITAVINAEGSSGVEVNKEIMKHMGTSADASTYLTSSSFSAVVKSVPSISTAAYLNPLAPAAAGGAAAALTGSSSGLEPGVIAGAVVGGVAGLALIAVLIYFLACKKTAPTGKNLPA